MLNHSAGNTPRRRSDPLRGVDSEIVEALTGKIFGDDVNAPTAANVLGLNTETLARKLRSGEIVGYKRGGEWYIPTEELAAYRQRQLDRGRWKAQTLDAEEKLRWRYERLRDTGVERRWSLLACAECAAIMLTQKKQRWISNLETYVWGRYGECAQCGAEYWDQWQDELYDDHVDAAILDHNSCVPGFHGDKAELEYRRRCYEDAYRRIGDAEAKHETTGGTQHAEHARR